ncbi:40S ribosomal protein S10 [Sigmodon hispidus]
MLMPKKNRIAIYELLFKEGVMVAKKDVHMPSIPSWQTRTCPTFILSHPETGRPRPKGPEGERPARFTRGEADRDTYRKSAVPPGADKKAEAGAGSATEFQFRGGFGHGRGQPPQ